MTEPGRRYGGRYEVTGLLASGGMAEVYLARDQLLGRPVALKVLHPEFARDKAFIERFRREAQAAASLNDPRVVAVFDWGSDDGTYYIVMEYVEGRTLREIIQTEGPLPARRAAEIAVAVCSALHFAHQHGIIHRDVKPANIAITGAGQTKVMDFGIARAAVDASQTVTQTGTVMGTAAYLSPEQAQAIPVDARSDVYSAGVVLYEMLAKKVPFKGDSAVSIAYKHVKEDPNPPSRINPEVPAELDAIVMKALAKNPDNRYQSAQEMRADLERFLGGGEVEATPLLPSEATTALRRADRTAVLEPARAGPPPGRKALAYLLIFLLFLGILVAVVALAFSLLAPSAKTVVVPDVVGKPFAEAQRVLDADGLVAVLDREEFSESVPDGFVISQVPIDGRKVKDGTKVLLVVSKGPERVEVPDVRGKKQEEAETLIREAGLEVGSVTSAFSDEVEKGRVISQDPGPGARVERGSSVDVVVSGGRNTVRVPNVTGLDEESARRILVEKGLNPVVKEACNTSERDGRVLDQDPAPRQEVPEGSDVTITVNRAPKVPAVVGQTEASAKTELEAAGFKVKVKHQNDFPGNLSQGRVVGQDPEAGEVACKGDTVTITVED